MLQIRLITLHGWEKLEHLIFPCMEFLKGSRHIIPCQMWIFFTSTSEKETPKCCSITTYLTMQMAINNVLLCFFGAICELPIEVWRSLKSKHVKVARTHFDAEQCKMELSVCTKQGKILYQFINTCISVFMGSKILVLYKLHLKMFNSRFTFWTILEVV